MKTINRKRLTDSDRDAVIVLALRHLAALGREQMFLIEKKTREAAEEKRMSRIFLNAAIIRAGGGI